VSPLYAELRSDPPPEDILSLILNFVGLAVESRKFSMERILKAVR
jgi:hypothetical protein